MSCLFAPLVLRVLTKCFLLHPTRLSMIRAQPHPAFPYRMRLAGLETCSVAQGLFTSAFFSNPGEPENFADFDQNFGRLLSADFNQVNKRLKTWQPLPSFS